MIIELNKSCEMLSTLFRKKKRVLKDVDCISEYMPTRYKSAQF